MLDQMFTLVLGVGLGIWLANKFQITFEVKKKVLHEKKNEDN